jgi:hypothetical protein
MPSAEIIPSYSSLSQAPSQASLFNSVGHCFYQSSRVARLISAVDEVSSDETSDTTWFRGHVSSADLTGPTLTTKQFFFSNRSQMLFFLPDMCSYAILTKPSTLVGRLSQFRTVCDVHTGLELIFLSNIMQYW